MRLVDRRQSPEIDPGVPWTRCLDGPDVALALKSGNFGLFSLWFPLLTTLVAAWVILWLVPSLAGAPLGTIRLFQPDWGLALVATALSGVLWAVFRLGVAYTGKPRPV